MTQEQLNLLKTQICKGATDDELKLFIQVCHRTKLDPFAKQIYGIKSGSRLMIQVSIDGLRLIAERSGKYRGQVGPYFCGTDGKWTEVWLASGPPAACRVGVLHRDFTEPLYAVCRFDAYAQSTPMWNKMPDIMLAKVAESLALRKAFPQDLSGVYGEGELPVSLHAPELVKPIQIERPPEAPRVIQNFAPQAEPAFDEAPQMEMLAPESAPDAAEWESYAISFGQWKGSTIREVGISKCLDKVKWFEDQAKTSGKAITGPVLKFKEMVTQAVQQGLS